MRRAPVSVHLDKDVDVQPETSGGYGWVNIGGVHVHCHTADDAVRLEEAARDLAATLRLQAMPKVERPT